MKVEKISDGKYNFTFDYSNGGIDLRNVIISSAKLKWVSMSKNIRRYNRKSKSHFRK